MAVKSFVLKLTPGVAFVLEGSITPFARMVGTPARRTAAFSTFSFLHCGKQNATELRQTFAKLNRIAKPNGSEKAPARAGELQLKVDKTVLIVQMWMEHSKGERTEESGVARISRPQNLTNVMGVSYHINVFI